jgi:hypothetical protein
MGSSCNIRTRINPHSPPEPLCRGIGIAKIRCQRQAQRQQARHPVGFGSSGNGHCGGGHGGALSSHAARHLDADHVVACGSSYRVTLDRDLGDSSIGAVAVVAIRAIRPVLRLAWVFSSLTVEVSGTEIRWYFGPGLWDYRVALSDIEGVRIVRNTWLNGFGIRMRPGWRLYNVSGLDAVELHLKTGDIRCIGTDDPQGLAGALKSSGLA